MENPPSPFVTPCQWFSAGNEVLDAMPVSFPLHCKFIPSFSTAFPAVSNFFGPNSQAAESMLPRVCQASQLNKSVATTALTMTNVFAMTCQTTSRPEGDSPLHDDPCAKISCPKLNPKAFPVTHLGQRNLQKLQQPMDFKQRQEQETASGTIAEG